jgi:hypothetical protein
MKSFYEMLSLLEQVPNATQAPGTVQPANAPQTPGSAQQPNAPQTPGSALKQPNAPQQAPGADPVENNKLKSLLGKNYEQFVAELKGNITDAKFLAFIKAGLQDGSSPQDDMVKFANINVPCINLIPTQNEIDVKGSLFYPLANLDSQTIISYLNGGSFAPGGPIVTCGGGKYIIDGHHRWSQLYCMNPNSQIQSLDMTAFSDPVLALKVVQLSIASTTGQIEVQTVQGSNLLLMSEQQIKDYIAKTMSDNAKQAFSQVSKGQDPVVYAQQYIWGNVSKMQQNNKPIGGASKRDFMPQTDKGGKFASELQKGTVNWTQNQQKQVAHVEYDSANLNEWLVLSGIKK